MSSSNVLVYNVRGMACCLRNQQYRTANVVGACLIQHSVARPLTQRHPRSKSICPATPTRKSDGVNDSLTVAPYCESCRLRIIVSFRSSTCPNTAAARQGQRTAPITATSQNGVPYCASRALTQSQVCDAAPTNAIRPLRSHPTPSRL